MNRTFARHALHCLAVFALTSAAAGLLAQDQANPSFVHTQGEDIVDATGHPLLLRGINLGNWLEPEG